MGEGFLQPAARLNDYLYFPVLVLLLTGAGLYCSVRTRFVQLRLLREACRLILEKPRRGQRVSSLQALLVSTASRVGTGNIAGVSAAICLGGPGSVFWMWLVCLLGAATAFAESTLAQIHKQRRADGGCCGGPAFYIEALLKKPLLPRLFCVLLIAAFAGGFNLLSSYNLQSSFAVYGFYDKAVTPPLVGALTAAAAAFCLLGGGRRIIRLSEKLVPGMGAAYLLFAGIMVAVNFRNVPGMLGLILRDAFDPRSVFGGLTGSCLVLGVKRGLLSNEAGAGSAPNASAAAEVSHPVKQGLVQTVSVYLDTLLICTATAFLCLSSGVPRSPAAAGAPYVQNAVSTVFGRFGPVFITLSTVLFAFTTLLGNLYYVDSALFYLNGKREPSRRQTRFCVLACALVVFAGALMEMDAAWTAAELLLGLMTLINVPCCLLLSGQVFAALRDYEAQRRAGKDPVFRPAAIGLKPRSLSCWNDSESQR